MLQWHPYGDCLFENFRESVLEEGNVFPRQAGPCGSAWDRVIAPSCDAGNIGGDVGEHSEVDSPVNGTSERTDNRVEREDPDPDRKGEKERRVPE